MWKLLYGAALIGTMSVIGVHSCSDQTPKPLAPVVQLEHVKLAPCAPTPQVAPDQTKKKTATFAKKKNPKKKFGGTHRHKSKTTHHHKSHVSSHHSSSPTKTFPSHAPLHLTGPPPCG